MVTTVESDRQDEGRGDTMIAEPGPAQSAAEAAEHLERSLAHFESMLDALETRARRPASEEAGAEIPPQELSDLRQALEKLFQRVEDALDRLGAEAQRLSDGASDLAVVAGRLEVRMNEMTRTLGNGRPPSGRETARKPALVPPPEPQFRPGDQAVGIVLAAVPGFQGLMNAQRALSGLPETAGASVVAYKNGEASIEVVLREPVSARRIVEGLRESTGHQLLIEESRPEALRLRLRFIDREGGAST